MCTVAFLALILFSLYSLRFNHPTRSLLHSFVPCYFAAFSANCLIAIPLIHLVKIASRRCIFPCTSVISCREYRSASLIFSARCNVSIVFHTYYTYTCSHAIANPTLSPNVWNEIFLISPDSIFPPRTWAICLPLEHRLRSAEIYDVCTNLRSLQ